MKKAFTLAEVLITLTIIGVIAAMTIPNLMKNYQNHANYVALKKSYSVLQNAYKIVEKDYGNYENWGTGSGGIETIANMFLENIKYTKKCVKSHGCFSSLTQYANIKDIANNLWTIENDNNSYVSVRLQDGANLCFMKASAAYFVSWDHAGRAFGVYSARNGDKFVPIIFVDVNGKKGPNQIGRDVFAFVATLNGLVPAGKDDTSYCRTDVTGYGPYGASCTYKVLQEGGIYY